MLSVVVPVFNEEESLQVFYKELLRVAVGLDKDYELIFIDDGSTDSSLEILRDFAKKDNTVRIFSFRKNQGKAEALTFGFQKSLGDYIITLDADLQDKPSELPKLFVKVKEGFDVVCGWRKNRQDPLANVLSSKFFNLITSMLWGLHLHDYNCGLKLYTSQAAKSLRLYGGLHRFIPALVFQKGFKVTEVVVLHEKRKYGKSKFGFSKVFKDIPDMFTMLFLTRYSDRPLHFFGLVGGILLFIGILILGYLTILRFQGETIGRRPLLFFGMLLVLSGLQVFFTGFLADLMINLSRQSKTDVQQQETTLLKYQTNA
jgi:glycosyltransferase involved in cell wall biosynthesis